MRGVGGGGRGLGRQSSYSRNISAIKIKYIYISQKIYTSKQPTININH